MAVIILLNLMTSSLDEVRIFTVRRKLMLVSLAIKRVLAQGTAQKCQHFVTAYGRTLLFLKLDTFNSGTDKGTGFRSASVSLAMALQLSTVH